MSWHCGNSIGIWRVGMKKIRGLDFALECIVVLYALFRIFRGKGEAFDYVDLWLVLPILGYEIYCFIKKRRTQSKDSVTDNLDDT